MLGVVVKRLRERCRFGNGVSPELDRLLAGLVLLFVESDGMANAAPDAARALFGSGVPPVLPDGLRLSAAFVIGAAAIDVEGSAGVTASMTTSGTTSTAIAAVLAVFAADNDETAACVFVLCHRAVGILLVLTVVDFTSNGCVGDDSFSIGILLMDAFAVGTVVGEPCCLCHVAISVV